MWHLRQQRGSTVRLLRAKQHSPADQSGNQAANVISTLALLEVLLTQPEGDNQIASQIARNSSGGVVTPASKKILPTASASDASLLSAGAALQDKSQQLPVPVDIWQDAWQPLERSQTNNPQAQDSVTDIHQKPAVFAPLLFWRQQQLQQQHPWRLGSNEQASHDRLELQHSPMNC